MMTTTPSQQDIDAQNQNHWNELCGTGLAKQLGINDSSQENLAKFDRFYFDYYPYLKKYLALDEIRDKNVLEVGLGFGTVGQLLALQGAHYHGLDIAPNAVAMTQHRLKQHNLEGQVQVGSMINCPFPDNHFDYVIAIGCFHHTGDMQACIDQTHRILKPGGKATIMVYNKFSLRQWVKWPLLTLEALVDQILGFHKSGSTEEQRAAYDASTETGQAAPETEFFSVKDIKRIFRQYQSIKITRENIDESRASRFLGKAASRMARLNGRVVRKMGLDLYIQATK